MFLHVSDASRAVGAEQESEELAHEIGVNLAVLDIHLTLSTRVKSFLCAALAYLTPSGFLVHLAAGTLFGKELPTGSAIQSARGNTLGIGCYFFHIEVVFK